MDHLTEDALDGEEKNDGECEKAINLCLAVIIDGRTALAAANNGKVGGLKIHIRQVCMENFSGV